MKHISVFLRGDENNWCSLIALNTGKQVKPWKDSDARLVLEDGSIWRAKSFGASGTQVGEVVFNTSLTGWDVLNLYI